MRSKIVAVGLLMVAAGCANAPSTSVLAEQNAALARRVVDDAWIKRDLSHLKENFADNYVGYTNGQKDTLDLTAFVQNTAKQYPDFVVTVEGVFATADMASVSWTFSATDPVSKKPMKFVGTTVEKIANGKIVEAHDYYDVLGPMMAAGATFTPPTAPSAAAPVHP